MHLKSLICKVLYYSSCSKTSKSCRRKEAKTLLLECTTRC